MKRVLIIDDDLMISRLLFDHLTNEGFSVEMVSSGEDGFKAAQRSTPDLIMLDVHLPDSTGFQMCGRFRQNPVFASVPIIMISGTARFPNQQMIGRQMGANDYILKPLDVGIVTEKIYCLLGLTPKASPKKVEAEKPPVVEKPEAIVIPAPVAPRSAPIVTPPPLPPMPLKPMQPPPVAASVAMQPDPGWKVEAPPPMPRGPQTEIHLAPSPSALPPMIPIPPTVDPLPMLSQLSTLLDFESAAAPEVRPEAVPEARPEPIWYELPLGPVREMSETPLMDQPSTIHFGSEERELVETPVEEIPELAEPMDPPPAPEVVEETLPDVPSIPDIQIPEPVQLPEEWLPSEPRVAAIAISEEAPVPEAAPARVPSWGLAWALVGVHLILVAAGCWMAQSSPMTLIRGLSFTLGGWAFLLGLLVVAATTMRIPLEGREAVGILGVAIVPIVVRACAGIYVAFTDPQSFVHFMGEASTLPPPIFWSHPLDIFQMVSLAIVGFYLHKKANGSLEKVCGAVLLMGAAWALLGRGYFRPF